MASKTLRSGKKQAQNHGERLFLKKNLSSILGELGALIVREEAVRLAQRSSSVPEFVRAVAGALEGTQGQESTYSVRILGTLSDLALKRMSWAEKQAPLESP